MDVSNIPNSNRYPSANDLELFTIEKQLNVILPDIYKELLRKTNGLSCESGLSIYGTEDLVERNHTWETAVYAPGYLAIGDDGGGNVLLMTVGVKQEKVYLVDSGDMNPRNASLLTDDFKGWVHIGLPIETELVSDPSNCKIVLIETPIRGLQDLVTCKSILGLTIPTPVLVKGSKSLPFTLVEGYPYGKARKLLEQVTDHDQFLRIIPMD